MRPSSAIHCAAAMHTRAEIQAALDDAHGRLVTLIESLDERQLRVPFHPGINPPIWEGGHAAFFFEIFLLRRWKPGLELMPGYDPIWDSFVLDHEDRWVPGMVPDRATTLAYMERVRGELHECLARREFVPEDAYLYKYGIFHQHMHIESMLWARQTLGYPPPPFVQAVDVPDASGGPLGEDARVPAGRYWIGMPARSADFAGRDFAFDAEKPGLWVELPAFAISRTLVSNREFLRFVEAGGYRDESHWSWGGRKWLRVHAARDPDVTRPAQGAPAGPLYWKEEEGGWWLRHFERWLPLPLDCPVTHVSYWEAEAYCQWAGRRLPSEYEWEAAALGRTEEASPRIFPWGERMEAERADLDARSGGLQPVTAFPAGDSPFGCRQMLGSAWEWTASPFLPYPGFTADMYPFMSTLQFGYHKTVKGGSCATASALIRGTYRQAYLPQRRDVFVGFRTCAK